MAFVSGFATAATDHEVLLSQVKVPVLFTHHFHEIHASTGTLMGAISDMQVKRVEELVTGTGNTFTYKAFPRMPQSLHSHSPEVYAATISEWIEETLPNMP